MNKNMRISLVIPVYNEAERIAACLRAVAAQTTKPYEVLVIDNNSTDETRAIVSRFPFATLLNEPRQGVVHARDRGFSAARGDIIARIDGDTLIAPDWIANLQQLFTDPALGAVTGTVTYRDITACRLVNRLDLFWRRRMARLLGPEVALQGANMALRRSIWQEVRHTVCRKRGEHEDFDLAIHTNWAGYQVRFDERLTASVCYRQADYDVRSFSRYALISPRTYAAHGLKSGRYMYQVVFFVIALYPVISFLSRGYDRRLQRFSWSQLFSGALTARVNPATYVD